MVSTLIANPSDPSLRVTTQALHWTAGGPPRRESLCENSAIQKDGSSPANSQVRKGGFHPSGAAPLGWKPPFLTCELAGLEPSFWIAEFSHKLSRRGGPPAVQ